MYSSYQKRVVASPKFKMLVAHPARSSDPSKGEVGNPVPLRQVFETQVISSNTGDALLGNTKSREALLRIKVETADFGNPNLGNAPPYYNSDEIQIVGQVPQDIDRLNALKAGSHFGKTEGEGAGDVDDIAADLASILNDMKVNLKAEVDPNNLNHVLVYSRGVFDDLFIKVYSYSYLLLGGDPPFVLEDSNGNILYDPVSEGAYIKILRKGGLSPMDIS
jgi:hypothetical protein